LQIYEQNEYSEALFYPVQQTLQMLILWKSHSWVSMSQLKVLPVL